MELKTKFLLVELFGGICGWIWIFTSAAALFFLGAAIFTDSPWPRFFWAFAISAVAKWLTRGFRQHHHRIAMKLSESSKR